MKDVFCLYLVLIKIKDFGKSFLMVKVIQTLQDEVLHRNDSVLCYFLCNRGNTILRSTRRVLDHLIAQLYEHAASGLPSIFNISMRPY